MPSESVLCYNRGGERHYQPIDALTGHKLRLNFTGDYASQNDDRITSRQLSGWVRPRCRCPRSMAQENQIQLLLS
jgi:hypothetical protein